MKRASILVLVIAAMIFQASCGAVTGPANDVDRLIEAIGYVDISKEDAVKAAEDAYNALSDGDKVQVEKHSQLVAARRALEEKKKAQATPPCSSLIGEWAELRLKEVFEGTLSFQDVSFTAPPTVFELASNGIVVSNKGVSGKWTYDGNSVVFEYVNAASSTYKTLSCAGKQLLCENSEKLYIKKADISSFLSEVFVKVQLSPENANTYLVLKPFTCDALDALGVPYGKTSVTTIANGVYPTGLVFYASSGFAAAVLNPTGNIEAAGANPYATIISGYPELSTLGNVTGTLYFIKSQYAACTFVLNDNSLDAYHRQLSVFNGSMTLNDTSLSFSGLKPVSEMMY